ncbi:MAG: hypothetical protein NTY41_11215, partial [Proteobacteria bacterium]|nr:hypothetical protein [Pseudomonadota bacterium]
MNISDLLLAYESELRNAKETARSRKNAICTLANLTATANRALGQLGIEYIWKRAENNMSASLIGLNTSQAPETTVTLLDDFHSISWGSRGTKTAETKDIGELETTLAEVSSEQVGAEAPTWAARSDGTPRVRSGQGLFD